MAGRVLSIDHWWDTWGGSSYTSTYIVGNACTYEIGTGDNRGLKTGDTFLTDSSGSPATAWTQSYGYDANFDYLTSASYGDSQPNATQSWTYDAAGNRTSDYTGSGWTYDNLNRMTASPGMTYTNDILGNRTAITPTPTGSVAGAYTWDCLNRLLTTTQPTVSTGGLTGVSTASMSYEYRADGMRVEKILHSGEYTTGIPGGPPAEEVDDVYSRYRYDGQMPMETFVTKADSSVVLTENGLGARGLDYTSVTNSSGTSVLFPIYDAHGNEVASLSRSGSSYSLSNQRSYGAWGEVRQGATTGGPRGRYCGNLGHVQDDETSLIYMRARYYEPGSGRFVSEDPGRNGANWFQYCGNQPVTRADSTGKDWSDIVLLIRNICGLIGDVGLKNTLTLALKGSAVALGGLCEALATACFAGGMALAELGEGLSESSSWAGRMSGAVCGWAGAKAIAAGIEFEEVAIMLELFGDVDTSIEGMGEYVRPYDPLGTDYQPPFLN